MLENIKNEKIDELNNYIEKTENSYKEIVENTENEIKELDIEIDNLTNEIKNWQNEINNIQINHDEIKKKPKKQRIFRKRPQQTKKKMETDFDNNEHVVIDMGNAFTKIGFSGDLPTLEIPSIMSRNKILESDKKIEISSWPKEGYFWIWSLRYQYKADYNIHFLTPGDHKEKTSKEFLDLLKNALENKLGISHIDYDLFVNMSPVRNDENIKTFGRLFIEELGFKANAIINSSSLELYATGKTSELISLILI